MVIPAGYAQANIRFGGSSAPTGAEVVLGLDVGGFAGTPTDAAAEVFDAWQAGPLTVQVSTLLLEEVLVKYGPESTGPSGSVTGSVAGLLGVAGIQPGTALLVNKQTGSGGRSGRGRLFMPGMTEADTTESGAVDAAYLAEAQVQFLEFGTALDAAGLPVVILHSAGAPITTPTPVLQFQVQGRVATQRRRLRR